MAFSKPSRLCAIVFFQSFQTIKNSTLFLTSVSMVVTQKDAHILPGLHRVLSGKPKEQTILHRYAGNLIFWSILRRVRSGMRNGSALAAPIFFDLVPFVIVEL